MKIEAKRLILRPPTMKDAKDLAENANNLNISKWMILLPYPYTIKDAKWYINYCKKKFKEKPVKSYDFVIELKSERKIIGAIALNKIDFDQGTAGGGFWIGEKYWGEGYGTEAMGEILNLAFNKLKLRKVELGYLKGNPSSFKVQKKFGFKIEGTRRKGAVCKATGKIHDEVITGLLREEWKK